MTLGMTLSCELRFDNFALLRLVGGMSKRVCSLIEQSVKWVHRSDGTRERQVLCPGSSVPAPSLFSLKGINAAEAKAEVSSGLCLQEHGDHKGADICGKQYAVDTAMLRSISNTSRSAGMATQGTRDDPHVIIMTGDGAGITDAE